MFSSKSLISHLDHIVKVNKNLSHKFTFNLRNTFWSRHSHFELTLTVSETNLNKTGLFIF